MSGSAASGYVDRRRHPRFAVAAAYTRAVIRKQDEQVWRYECHVHDISEGGVRFEADIPIQPGSPIAMQIDLPERPGDVAAPDGPGRAVFVLGNLVWCSCDEPGPASMALAITRFARAGDKERLIRRLSQGAFARVA